MVSCRAVPYEKLTLDLSDARDGNEEDVIQGEALYVREISSGATLTVKLNNPSADEIPLDESGGLRFIRARFEKLYFTNSAQAGKEVEIWILKKGIEFGTISLMPDPTPRGSEGVAFRQKEAIDEGWISPTGFNDASGDWSYERNAYDDDTGTGAVITPPVSDWSNFLILTLPETLSNKLKVYVSFVTIQFDLIDIDVYKDGAWVGVYEGFAQNGWDELSFSEGKVKKIRIRVHGKEDADVDQSLKEVKLWEVASTSGELIIVSGGTPVFEETQSVDMTTENDDVILTVPTGKEWLVYHGYLTNNSGASIDMTVNIRDANNVGMGYLFTRVSLGNGTLISIPHREGTERHAEFGHGAYPIRLIEGQKILMRWGADAGKSGTSYWFLMIKQFPL